MTELSALDALYQQVADVPDPEIPVVTVHDLGILRDLEIDADGTAVAYVTPTYSGCPAVVAIENSIKEAIEQAGYKARVTRVMSPPWSTDWITVEGRQKLKAYGIAPPVQRTTDKRALFTCDVPACPQCDSPDTQRISEFGSTACKALYRCNQCLEPFDYFKCL